jgi:outer membrane murein-binding lipoprotein Lpp
MHKILVAIVTSAFVIGSASGFAADTAKKEDLTKEQRVDMRNRADKLTQERAQASTQVKTVAKTAPKANVHHVKKAKKVSRHDVKKVQPKT